MGWGRFEETGEFRSKTRRAIVGERAVAITGGGGGGGAAGGGGGQDEVK